jgi:hypothetical protein
MQTETPPPATGHTHTSHGREKHTSTNSTFPPPRALLTNTPAYSHEHYPLPAKATPLSFFSHIPLLDYVSPSRPHTAHSISALSHAWARNKTPAKRRRAPFPNEVPEPSQETTDWESALPGYLRSCRSRFFSVSSGTRPPFLALTVRTVPNH